MELIVEYSSASNAQHTHSTKENQLNQSEADEPLNNQAFCQMCARIYSSASNRVIFCIAKLV